MMTEITLEARGPLLFAEKEMRSERQARLLEAGEFPDKGLMVTEADLDGLVACFIEGVPVKIEHTDSPLDPLCKVCQIWREGSALFGTLAFPMSWPFLRGGAGQRNSPWGCSVTRCVCR